MINSAIIKNFNISAPIIKLSTYHQMKVLLVSFLLVFGVSTAAFSQFILWDAAPGYHFIFRGSGTDGAPSAADGAVDFLISGSGCVISADGTVNSMSLYSGSSLSLTSSSTLTLNAGATINSGATLTINSGCTLLVDNSINNSGTITVNSGATLMVTNSFLNSGTVTVSAGGNLIQTGSGSVTGTGYNINLSGYASADRLNYWSSPISSASLSATFSGSNECDFYYLDASSQEWTRDIGSSTCTPTAPASGDGNMDVGRGYSIGGGGSPTFSGTINNGTINESITASGTTNPDWSGSNWNLIGNPYPSSIDASTFMTSNNTVISSTIYFWDDDNTIGAGYDETTDYATWNSGSGGTASSGGGTGSIPNGSIPMGQGFIVQALSTSSVVFSNDMRGGSNTQFFKREKETIPRLWISANQDKHASSQILIAFSDKATNGDDVNYDSPKVSISDKYAFGSLMQTQSTAFAIQGFAKQDLETRKEIPLTISSGKSGITTFQIDGFENWDSTLIVSIKDHVTGKVQNLKNGSFAVYLTANKKYNSRFAIIIINPAGPPLDIDELTFSNLKIYYANDEVTIQDEKPFESVEVYTITGSLLHKSSITATSWYTLPLNQLTPGIYIARIRNVLGERVSRRFSVY